MRFSEGGPSIPNHLLEQCDAGRVVFFCGAGVSQYGINSELHMPNFLELTKLVVNYFKPSKYSDIIKALSTWEKNTNYRPIPLDEIFFLLQNMFDKEEVSQVVTNILSCQNSSMIEPVRHKHISQISRSLEGLPQIVTTNFDVLFERAIRDSNIKIHFPPFLPDLSQGTPITGITYLHGRISEDTHHTNYDINHSSDLILSSAELGRAYLSEGWATDFVRQLISEYTVVLIGYKADDPPIHYLLVGMGSGNMLEQPNLYAFDRGESDTLESRWRAKGVIPIAYSDHDTLWKTIEQWASRTKNIQNWRDKTIRIASQDPKTIKPFQRGQVVYLMNTVDGFKKFSELTPTAHPEWINVFDKNIRVKKDHMWRSAPETGETSKSPYTLDNEDSDNELDYTIIDPVELLTLNDYNEDYLNIPQNKFIKSKYLLDWICQNFDSVVMIWWIANQSYINISTVKYIRKKLMEDKDLSRKERLMWSLVLEYQAHKSDRDSTEQWQQFFQQVESDGWNESVIREFSRLTAPKIMDTHGNRRFTRLPFSSSFETLDLYEIVDIDVKFSEIPINNIQIPDQLLMPVLRALQENFTKASLMISEIDFLNDDGRRRTPTVYQKRCVSGDISQKEFTSEVLWFLNLLNRLVKTNPASAKSFTYGWPVEDHYFFRKFKLFALNLPSLFDAREVYEFITSLTDEQFWSANCTRELLFLIEDRKDEFTESQRNRVFNRVLTFPENEYDSEDDKEEGIKFGRYTSASYGIYLVEKGFKISQKATKKLNHFAKDFGYIRNNHSSIVQSVASRGHHRATDYSIDSLTDIPLKDVIDVAIRNSIPSEGRLAFALKNPFSGLVREKPEVALGALIGGKIEKKHIPFWKVFLKGLPPDASKLMYSEIISYWTEAPEEYVYEMGNSLSEYIRNWFADSIEENESLIWKFFDRYLSFWTNEPIVYGEGNEIDGGVESSEYAHRSTYRNAIERPIGKITECLLDCIKEDMESVPDGIKSRVDKLMMTPGPGRSYCLAVLTNRIGLLYKVDPDWTKSQLVPHFDFGRNTSEAAWSGLVASKDHIDDQITSDLMNFIVALFPWVYQFPWSRRDVNVCAYLVTDMGVQYSKEFHQYYNDKIRDCIRGMKEETRLESISLLHDYILHGEVSDAAISFIRNVWPKDSSLSTEKLTSQWIQLLVDSDEDFPTIYSIVKSFLVPLKCPERALAIFFKNQGSSEPLADRFPMQVLDVLDRVIPETVDYLYIDLPEMLKTISTENKSVNSSRPYLRLLDIAERTPLRLNTPHARDD